MNIGNQLSLPGGEGQARRAAQGLRQEQIDTVALHAGLRGWLQVADSAKLRYTADKVGEALRMPAASPPIMALRRQLDTPDGVQVSGSSPPKWTLDISETRGVVEGQLYTGVQLVCRRNAGGIGTVDVPLDISIDPSRLPDVRRPDRLSVTVGELQLARVSTFDGEAGQRLLLLAENFMRLLNDPDAGNLKPLGAPDQISLKDLFKSS